MKRKWVPFVVVLALLGLGCTLGWFLLTHDLCQIIPAPRDSKSLQALEERELMGALVAVRKTEMTSRLRQPYPLNMPMPQRVTVSGNTAIVQLDSEIALGNYLYVDAWYDVYRAHHSGWICVHLHATWDSRARDFESPRETL